MISTGLYFHSILFLESKNCYLINNLHLQAMATSITTLVEEMPLAHVVDSKFVDKVCAHCMIPTWER